MNAIEIIFVTLFSLFGVMTLAFMLFMIKSWFKNRHRRRTIRILKNQADRKVWAELEEKKRQAELEIEKQREAMKRKYCPYCGSKHESKSKQCENCGAELL